jgi:4-hydroxy-2-oxoheptanedioate aldolase
MMDANIDVDLRNGLLESLKAGKVVGMMSVRLTRGPEIAALARAAGFDALYVDMEHSTLSADDASRICMACLGAGITPLVRVPLIDEAHVSRLLDAGAMGIIGPHIHDAAQARRLVELCKFPPIGRRSSVAWLPQLGYRSLSLQRVGEVMNQATAVVAMIEDSRALANVDEIAAVDGVDMLFVGSNDLCADLGLTGQEGHPRLDAAMGSVIDACRRHGKAAAVGGLARHPALLKRYVAMGARLVSLGTDLAFLLDGARQQAAIVRTLAETR